MRESHGFGRTHSFRGVVSFALVGWLGLATPSCSNKWVPQQVGTGGALGSGGNPGTVLWEEPLIDVGVDVDGGGGSPIEFVSGPCSLGDRPWSDGRAHCEIIPCPDGYDCSGAGNVGGAAGSAGAAGAAGAASLEAWPYTLCPVGGGRAASQGCTAYRECIQPPVPSDDGQLSCCY